MAKKTNQPPGEAGDARGRGRPKGSKNKASEAAAAPPGHNSTLSDDEEKALTLSHLPQYAKLIEAQKKASSDLQAFGRRVKVDLGKHGIAMLKIALDKDDPEASAAHREKMEAEHRMMRWLGLPLNSQDDLFGEDRRPREEIVEQEGFEAGSDRTTPRKPPEQYGLTTPAAQAWYKGYDKGQQLIFDAMAKRGNPLLQNHGETLLQPATLGDDNEDGCDGEWPESDHQVEVLQ